MSASGAFQQEVQKEIKRMKWNMKRGSVLAANALRTAEIEVLSGTRKGERYRSPATKAYYTASAAGEPPAARTGKFRDSWIPSTEQAGNRYISRIESNLTVNGYLLGQLLEDGTRKMAPRPYAEKIRQQALPSITQLYSSLF